MGKDVFLFAIGVHRDYPDEELFFFHWKDQEMILPLKKKNQLPEYENLESPNLMGKSFEMYAGEYKITYAGRFETGIRSL